MAVETLSEASLPGLDKQQRVDVERERGGHDGLFYGLCLLARAGLEDVLEVPRRDEEDADVRDDLRLREEELVLGRDGVEQLTKACGRGNVPMVKNVRSRKREWSETSESP